MPTSNWKGEALTFAMRWGLPGLASLLMAILLTKRGPHRWIEALASRRWLVFAATRPLLVVFLYVLAGYRGSSDFFCWVDIAKGTEGSARFVSSAYGPLFGPILAAGHTLFPWGSGCGVLAGFILGDALALAALPRLARLLWGAEGESWSCAWHLLTPMMWCQCIVWSQDEPLFVGLLMLGTLVLLKGRPILGGLLLGLGAASTKVSFAPYAFGAIALGTVGVGAFSRATAGGGAVVVLAYGAKWLAGGSTMSIFQALDHQAQTQRLYGAGISIPDFLVRSGIIIPPVAALAICTAAILGIVLLVHLRLRADLPARRVLVGLAGVHLAFLVLAPACLASYGIQAYALIPFTWACGAAPGARNWGLVAAAVAEFLAVLMWSPLPGGSGAPETASLTLFHVVTTVWLLRVVLRARVPAIPPASTAPSSSGMSPA